MTHADYIRLGGTEGAEEIMWLAMRGALSPGARKIHQNYYLPDDRGDGRGALRRAAGRRQHESPITNHQSRSSGLMNPQLKDVENLAGTYLFDLERSARALRLNRFLHGLTQPAKRALFREAPDAAFEKAGLTGGRAAHGPRARLGRRSSATARASSASKSSAA